jgi:hypothetical protein
MEGQIMHYPLQSSISMCRYFWSNRQTVHRYQKSKIAFGKNMNLITYLVIFFCNGTRLLSRPRFVRACSATDLFIYFILFLHEV